jgi:serine/threonine-protein kinase
MTEGSSTTDPRSDPDLSGRRLGDYQLVRRLARGGMADVYLAEQRSLRRQVAFKVLRKSLAGDEMYVKRFHHEAQAVAALVHANIVQIYEVGCIDGIHFIAQEYVRGQNLKQLVNRRGPLKVKLAVSILRQVAAALHRASSRGIIHRDIKPENIMLAATGEVKVADFGLARAARDEGQLNLTQVGVTLGTPLYMSPEQVEGRQLDARSDLYSLGVTCYEMLTGHPPFTGETALAVAVQHLKNEAPRLDDLRPDLPGGLCRIVHQMLAKKPALRHQDAAELLRDLRGLRIDGLEADWDETARDSEMAEVMTQTQERSAATQQLAHVMVTESLTLGRQNRAGWWSLLLVGALIAGAAAGWARRPASLLRAAGEGQVAIERKATAEEQFRHAMGVYTERAFRAVIDYFPPDRPENELYANKANLHIAYLYLESNNDEQALDILTGLAAQDSDVRVQARALVALIDYHTKRNGPQAEIQKRLFQLEKALDSMGELSPGQMMEWIQSLPLSVRRDFEQWESENAAPGRDRSRRPGDSPGTGS